MVTSSGLDIAIRRALKITSKDLEVGQIFEIHPNTIRIIIANNRLFVNRGLRGKFINILIKMRLKDIGVKFNKGYAIIEEKDLKYINENWIA
jgi:hypothetical protein